RNVYDSAGRDGLIAAIKDRVAPGRFESGVYLLADPSFVPVAGNLEAWPAAFEESRAGYDLGARGWETHAADPPGLRAAVDTPPDRHHFVVRKKVGKLHSVTR